MNEALRDEGAEIIITGIHKDGYLYVHCDAESADIGACVLILEAAGYKASTGRVRKFRPTKGDCNEMRKQTHMNVEGYMKYE